MTDGETRPTGYTFRYRVRPAVPPSPRATYGLLAAIGAVFALELVVELSRGTDLLLEVFAINIDWMYRPWTLVTSTLAHGGFEHLFFNGLFLYMFGPSIEAILGPRRYLVVFFLTGALSGVAQTEIVYYLRGDTEYALGASGALMALLGLSLIFMPRSRIIVFPLPIPLPLWIGGIAFATLDVLGAFNPYSNVGNFAHLSGLLLGLAYGLQVKRELARRGLRV